MTRIPSSLLRQRGTIEGYEGETGESGPSFGDPVTVKCRVEGHRQRFARGDGVEVHATERAFIRPDVSVTVAGARREPRAEDRFTVNGRAFEIVQVVDARGLNGLTHRELMLA